VTALTDVDQVEFQLIDDTPGSGLSLTDAYAFLAGRLTPAAARAGGLPLVASAADVDESGMIALLPSAEDAARLALAGGTEEPDKLHVTLAFLGDNLGDLSEDLYDEFVTVARRYAGGSIEAQVFSVGAFNPGKVRDDGAPGGAVVLGVGHDGGRELQQLRDNVVSALRGLGGAWQLPEQHVPWVPHITLTYTNDLTELAALADRVGPVTFDRVRVVVGDRITDIPLGRESAMLTADGGDAMPWKVVSRDGKFCVVKKTGGGTVACHDTRSAADAQVRALYASEEYGLQLAVEAAGIELAQERDVNLPGRRGHQLRDHWVRGPGAAEIVWGTDGAFARCVTKLGKYVRDPEGLCAEYHKAATGEWPAEKGVESALTAAVADEPSDEPEDEPWEGVLVVEGVESGDGRLFSFGSLDWAPLPLPLTYQPANSGGHKESVDVGSIQHIFRKDNEIWGRGVVFASALAGPHGDGIRHRMAGDGAIGGVSADVDKTKDADIELVYADGQGGPFATPTMTIFNRGRIRGATLVTYPAFVEAKLRFTGNTLTAAADCGCDNSENEHVIDLRDGDLGTEVLNPLVASGNHTITIPNLPPAAWFDEPTDVKLSGALTITDEGRVYAVVAPADTTHRNVRTKVPRNLDFSRFHKGETIVEGGGRVVTGVITASCGHAATQNYGTLQNRIEHYDNSCSVLANVRVGESKHGYIWAAGALNPGADAGQVAQALGCALSLDVQPHPDKPGVREFIAAHLVPVPGFPLARTEASVRIENGTLVAATLPVELTRAQPRLSPVDNIKHTLARRVGLAPTTRKHALARRLGVDATSRKQQLQTRIGD
jgi:2'-5' RNA ligase